MTSPSSYPLLARVNDPADVRRLARTQLPQLAQELRAWPRVGRDYGNFGRKPINCMS